jgi:hypothetical protein
VKQRKLKNVKQVMQQSWIDEYIGDRLLGLLQSKAASLAANMGEMCSNLLQEK